MRQAYGMAYNLTGNAADAEDLLQEAALLAFRGFDSFEKGTNFKGWFYRILTNAYISRYRRRKRAGEQVDIDDVPDLFLYRRSVDAGLTPDAPDPATALLDRLGVDEIRAALDRLPDEYRMAAVLYFMEDLSYQEIADALDIPVGTVRSRLHRGRKLLQRELWREAVERGIVSSGVGGKP